MSRLLGGFFMMGRLVVSDSSITPEMVGLVLAEIAEGIPLRQIARTQGFGKSSWYRLMEADPDIAGRFARARIEGFDAIAEECLDIADETTNDTRKTADGNDVANSEWISRSKLRVETRLKLLAKWDPKRYGDKPAGDADNPIHVVSTIRREVVDPNAG